MKISGDCISSPIPIEVTTPTKAQDTLVSLPPMSSRSSESSEAVVIDKQQEGSLPSSNKCSLKFPNYV